MKYGGTMEEIITISINDKYELIGRYDEKNISRELLEYILKETILTKKNKTIKIVINKRKDIEINSVEIVKEGLKQEYERSLEERRRNNLKQLFFLLLGMIFIFIATRMKYKGMWREILLITGWVPIWEMIEIELFPDVYGRRERRTIKKLLKSEIIEKNI